MKIRTVHVLLTTSSYQSQPVFCSELISLRNYNYLKTYYLNFLLLQKGKNHLLALFYYLSLNNLVIISFKVNIYIYIYGRHWKWCWFLMIIFLIYHTSEAIKLLLKRHFVTDPRLKDKSMEEQHEMMSDNESDDELEVEEQDKV